MVMSTFPPLAAAALPADAIEVGRIADAWGVKGWFKVLPHSSNPEALLNAPEWFLQPASQGAKTFTGTLVLPVRQVRPHSDTLVACSEGIADRTGAEALRGARIFVARAHFPPAEEGEYYWVDLGQVHELLPTGPQTTLVLDYQDGDVTRQRLIPFVSAFVDQVDLAAQRITVDWQPDY